ncbi:hypothetical protein PYW08_012469 [Mythimna loreyi]|uniref:Uncharacterized protein n=1 Tax=Mythimna loreyi TaxID=667449 RepID=A0ACC2Q080_9NEOP|nr:hypothetical protein PYW08_012469 [Mythimna loreyi]
MRSLKLEHRAHTAHLSLTGGGMLNAGYSFALGLSNSIAIVFFTVHASCTRPRESAAGRTLPVLRRATPRPTAPRAPHRGAPRPRDVTPGTLS